MRNAEKIIDWKIDNYRKRLSDDPDCITADAIADGLLATLLQTPEIWKSMWKVLNHVQSAIESMTGQKYTMRDALIRSYRKKGGDEKELRKELYRHLPTDEELSKKRIKAEAYHVPCSRHCGTIIDVKYEQRAMSRGVTGVKHDQSQHFTPSNGYFGGNGTYRSGYPEVYRCLYLIIKLINHPHVKINVRSDALKINDRKNVTEAFVSELRNKLIKKKVEIEYLGNDPNQEFKLIDPSMLQISN
jgi:hypothetical protein